jgi:hypothetical protein
VRTEDYPSWIAGRLPKSLSGDVAVPAAPVSTFRQGKKQIQKSRTKSDERKVTMQLRIRQLDRALEVRARELDAIPEEEVIHSNLADALYDFLSLVIRLNDETTNHRGKKPPKTLSNARALKQPLESLKLESALFVPKTANGLELQIVLNELVDDVENFVHSIEMTHATVKVIDGIPQIRNRQRNIVAMAIFGKMVEEHQEKFGAGKFPKLARIKSQLENEGHHIQERTIRDWERQIRNNTFGDFVQARKRQ